MSEPVAGASRSGRRGGGFAQSMAFSAARGGGLIALAIVVGLVLLQVVDSSGGGASDAGITVTTEAPEPTEDPVPPEDAPPPEEAPPEAEAPPPSEIRVKVLNGADPDAPLAGNLSEELRVAGYQTLPPDNTSPRTGDVVFCKEAFAASAPALAAAVSETAVVEPFPEPPPENAENVEEYDCLVVLGS